MNSSSLNQIDHNHLWHPFTQQEEWVSQDNIIIDHAKGNILFDTKGNRYIDGVSSLWVNIHGHGHPFITKAIKRQLDKVAHSTFLGLTHEPAILLTQKLLHYMPDKLTRFFYSDDGSTAIEIALKMAYQYWQQHPDPRFHAKKSFISFTSAYHGDTIGAVSVGGISLFYGIYKPLLFDTIQVQAPYPLQQRLSQAEAEDACLIELRRICEDKHTTIGGLIIEPLMQAAAGMIQTTPHFLKKVAETCKEFEVLLIADEVATGFGRTGAMFACEKANISPDFLCLAKGLTGGYLPMAVTVTTESIYDHFLGKHTDYKTFFHGHSFTANPLGCAAAIASLDLFSKNLILEKAQKKIKLMKDLLAEINKLPHVAQVRQEGFMVGIELYLDTQSGKVYPPQQRMGWTICQACTCAGVFLRPLSDIIVVMPPLSITEKELKIMFNTLKQCIISATQ